jgi:hypothetical protein
MQVEATEKIGSERILRGGSRPQAQEDVGAPSGERSARRFASTDVSATQNLKGFLVALFLSALVLLVSCGLGLLIALSFYGYEGLR